MENMIKRVKELLIKYKEIISYLVFGVLTTLVNILCYEGCTKLFQIDYLISTIIAWIVSVLFAYITNKIYVFESKTNNLKEIVKEITSFIGFRVLSGIIDIAFMYITVDVLDLNDSLMKITSNVVVVILNYIFSKIFIFKNKMKEGN